MNFCSAQYLLLVPLPVRLAAFVALLTAACHLTGHPPTAMGDELGEIVRQAVQRVDPSVVRLRPIGTAQTTDGGVTASMPTTGVVISEQGEILTSAFSLQGNPQAVLVETTDGQRYTARIVATDFVRKLVLLKVDQGQWSPAEAASPSAVRVGAWSIAVGRFFSADSSNVSVGIVSALNRVHGLAVQTDAKISPMNYGGPLIDLDGRVQGILVPMSPTALENAGGGVEWYDSGIGFAVPHQDALAAADRLRGEQDQLRGLMGIAVSSPGRFSPEILVSRVHRGGPGDRAGIRTGDRIVKVNDVDVSRSAVIESVVARSYAGDELKLQILRDGKIVSTTIELTASLPVVRIAYLGLLPVARQTDDNARPAAIQQPGGAPAEALERNPDAPVPDDAVADEAAAGDAGLAPGVDVVVMESGPAATAGLSGRITVLTINDEPTDDLPRLSEAVSGMSAPDEVVMTFRRPGDPVTLTATFNAGEVPSTIAALTAADVQHYVDDGGLPPDAAKVVRDEMDLGESGRCILFHSGDQLRQRLAGVLVLLTADETSEDAILRRWKPWILSHDLLIAVPVNPEKSRLSDVDIPLLGMSIGKLIRERPVDRSRLVLAVDETGMELAGRLFMNPRSPFRGLALEQGRLMPEKGFNVPPGSRRSVLLPIPDEDRQKQALLLQSATSLAEAGVMVFRRQAAVDNDRSDSAQARQIADWSILLKSL